MIRDDLQWRQRLRLLHALGDFFQLTMVEPTSLPAFQSCPRV